jgi:hypothetical protein
MLRGRAAAGIHERYGSPSLKESERGRGCRWGRERGERWKREERGELPHDHDCVLIEAIDATARQRE